MNQMSPAQVQQHRTIKGRILYTSKKPERLDQERGRETFTMTQHTDGKVTIRAQCEIDEPGPTVLRDVVYSVDEKGRPMDCLLRLTVGDRFMGAGFFRMGDDFIECESYGPAIGRISQRVEIDGPYDGFGSHPIVCDGYNTRCMDFAKGPHKRQKRSFLPSLDHRGATAPIIAENRLFLEYLGDETVTVAAGTFSCRHLRFTDEDKWMVSAQGAHPVYDVWVTADVDCLFVQGGVGGYMQTWYELVELDR
jgi:hypothetical protein